MDFELYFQQRLDREALYRKWLLMENAGRDPAWSEFDVFYKWAVSHGHHKGCRLYRTDRSLPWGPENCYVREPDNADMSDAPDPGFAARWNTIVNQIRAALGMPPLQEDRENVGPD